MRTIIPPSSGWEPNMYYLVDVAISRVNVIHRSIFYTGHLTENGKPGAYNAIWNPTYERQYTISDMYYLRMICPLVGGQSLEIAQLEMNTPEGLGL